MWCIPPEQNAAFVACMEDILDVYQKPFNKDFPVVCMDEKPYQLLGERYKPIPMSETNHKLKYDCEYERKGTCSIFMFTEPLAGWRYAHARQRRTKTDWAIEIKELLTVHYPNTPKICLVLDNLNTHTFASLYEAFPPSEARELAKRLEIHYTPKHGSWLNIAETELSFLSRQCLDNRVDLLDVLNDHMSSWGQKRNISQKGVDWQFTTNNARSKLKRLYPVLCNA